MGDSSAVVISSQIATDVARVGSETPERGPRPDEQAEPALCEPQFRCLSPNPQMDTDGRRENRGSGVRELQGRWPGLHWGRWEVGGGSSVVAQALMAVCGRWAGQDDGERTQQETLADRDGAS